MAPSLLSTAGYDQAPPADRVLALTNELGYVAVHTAVAVPAASTASWGASGLSKSLTETGSLQTPSGVRDADWTIRGGPLLIQTAVAVPSAATATWGSLA